MSIKLKKKSVKPTIKATKPTLKPVAPKAAATPAPKIAAVESPAKLTRNRGKVLFTITPTKLSEMIGADTPIGVSAKELRAIVVAAKSDKILAEVGL